MESSLKIIIKKKIGYNIYGYQVQIFPLTVPQFSKWIFESHFNIEHTRYEPRRLGTQTGCGGIKMPLLSYWIRAKKCVTDYNQGYSRVSQITKRGKLDMRSFSQTSLINVYIIYKCVQLIRCVPHPGSQRAETYFVRVVLALSRSKSLSCSGLK